MRGIYTVTFASHCNNSLEQMSRQNPYQSDTDCPLAPLISAAVLCGIRHDQAYMIQSMLVRVSFDPSKNVPAVQLRSTSRPPRCLDARPHRHRRFFVSSVISLVHLGQSIQFGMSPTRINHCRHDSSFTVFVTRHWNENSSGLVG
jgi:hypothetical protein